MFGSKKFLIVVLTATIVCGVAVTADAELVHHWKLDETGLGAPDAFGTVVDSTGNSLPGNNWGADTGAVGIDGTAYYFDAASPGEPDGVELRDALTAPPENMTFSFWMNPDTVSAGLTQEIFSWSQQNVGSAELYLYGDALAYGHSTSVGWTEVPANTPIPAGQLSHIAVVKQGLDISLYFNGEPDGSGTLGFAPGPTIFLALGLFGDGWRGDAFTGVMDDVQIYDEGLTGDQIRFLHDNPGSVVPEPSTLLLLVAGAFGLALCRRWR